MVRNKKPQYIIFSLVMLIFFLAWLLRMDKPVEVSAEQMEIAPVQRIGADPFIVDCTAYCDEGITASGKETVEGQTIAGAREWLGCTAILYEVDEDGTIGDFIGMYEFADTGWGIDGDILRGETVDIYISDEDACWEWGRRRVYVQVIDGKG